MTGLVCSLRDGDAMTSPRPYTTEPSDRTQQTRRGAPEFPRKLPKTYERLQLRRAGNTVQYLEGKVR
jgi:hypothetical protein